MSQSEDKIGAAVAGIVDVIRTCHERSDRGLVIVRCVGPTEVDHARHTLMNIEAPFKWRSLPVAELDPPDLVGAALRLTGQERQALVAYDLPKGTDGRLLNAFVERLKVAERKYVMGPYLMVLLLTLKEMRDLSDRVPSFWKSREYFTAWPMRTGGSMAFLPARTGPGMPARRGGGMAMADGGMAGVFDHVMVDGGSQIASQPGISTDSNMPVAGPWDGAPFTDPDSVPRYIAEAAPPAGRRWGSDVAPDDPDGGRLVDRCRALLDHRHTEYARQGLAKAAKRFRAQSNGAATAECYVMLGRASELRFDHTVALEWYEQALNLFESLGDLAGVSDCCAMTGHLRFLHGDLDGAFAYFDRALRSDEECQDELRIAAGYRRVGIILEERNKPKQARSLFRKAAEIEDRNKDRYAYSRSLNHQSRVARKLESFDDAEKLMQESLQIKEELDDDTGLATGYHELGNLRLEQSAFESALESYEQALEIEERLKDLQGIAVTMSQLGLVHRSLQNDVDSARCFGIARDLFHRLQSPYVVIVDQALDQVREIVDAAVFHDTQWEARAYLDDLLEEH